MATASIPVEALYYRSKQTVVLDNEGNPFAVYFKPDAENAVKYLFREKESQVLTHTDALKDLNDTLLNNPGYQAIFVEANINIQSGTPEPPKEANE